MIPSRFWFPGSLQERAAWYANFTPQLQVVGPGLGIVASVIANIVKDNENIQFLAQTAVDLDAFAEAVRQYRKIYTEGNIGDPEPAFPANPAFALPNALPTGAFERLVNCVEQIRVSATYTDETGALLGIIPQTPEGFNPGDAKPVLTVEVKPGNIVNVKFVRGGSDGVRIEVSIDKGDWTSQGNFFKSPAAIEIAQNVDNLPRLVAVRARYLVGNSPVGDWSDIATVQTIP